jgi:site-specific recombinase XerD
MAVYARTRDILIVKEALRHRSLTSTMVYAKVCDEQVRRAVDA